MLVLTRRLNEKIVFPAIHAEVQVLGMKGGQVRLGIEAPPQVAIVRDELAGRGENGNGSEPETSWSETPESSREFAHQVRNRLNDIGLNLAILRQRVGQGQTESAILTINRIEEELRLMRQELEREFARVGAGRREEVSSVVGTDEGM
jgi:two-component system, OmpR family, response regulator